jgi:hypothetical protein
MLKKSKISGIAIGSEEWKTSRLARFTSSNIWRIMGTEGLGVQGMTYIKTRVGEELTGKSSDKEFDTDALRHGLFYEAEAVNKFGLANKLDFIVCQQLVIDSSRFGGTPDGLIVNMESPDKTEYEVETLEVKCPPTYDNYIGLFLCDTPQDLKKEKKEYYWQVLDQMLICDCLKGHFMCYHPDFKAGNMNMIVFEKNYNYINKKGQKEFPLFNDLKLLKERKQEALIKFDEIREKLLSKGLF